MQCPNFGAERFEGILGSCQSILRTAQDTAKTQSQGLLCLAGHFTLKSLSSLYPVVTFPSHKERAEWGGSSGKPVERAPQCLSWQSTAPQQQLCPLSPQSLLPSRFTLLCPDLLTSLHLLPSNSWENSPSPPFPTESEAGINSNETHSETPWCFAKAGLDPASLLLLAKTGESQLPE